MLLDARRQPCGTAPKAGVHTRETPLHLAFSCYVVGPGDRVLVTRRSLAKRTWPGVWTNGVCGHPGPGEEPEDAVLRRGSQELGTALGSPVPLLPGFAYRAVDASGVVENEVCPVFAARAADDPVPVAEEVCDWAWAPWDSLLRLVRETPWVMSPWSVLQVREMDAQGISPPGALTQA